MARQINIACHFLMGYIKCELPEDKDVMVKVRTLWGTHTLKEDWENCSLKFRQLGAKARPFEALNVRLSHSLKKWETFATTAAAFVVPVFENNQENEKRCDGTEPPKVPPMMFRHTKQNVNDSSTSSKGQEQPRVCMNARNIINNPNHKLKGINNTKYCNICTPLGLMCSNLGPKNWDWSDNEEEKDDYCDSCTPLGLTCICQEPDNSNWVPHNQHLFEPQVTKDEEEEEHPAEESDWDTDLEDAQDYHTGVPTLRRQPWQTPKVDGQQVWDPK